ncbi:MAG: CTP synthase (glutamine hydrolyzing) [Candidatus Diapherotrites archaeon]|jgi:CTP synthase|uniref:CTP synthase n=1 Tax=Candidatus Iainarchaeum sp. TaxID=3101447 RepID=A0A8T5GDZ2_9ARCH|nr:CTP synthase (glutamine hydrolyzing) [Candidatus Diapherotrites archaeon]MBT7241413.1 CTP synthase (glutamine hydrolyzing) [Candidatus Diapherotrites archaeon]
MTKFIIVTGGVLSGLGKGILTASIGNLISQGKTCATIKCDGYLNVDPGTMNPVEHGEVFVLDDGTECDMDFGHYERFVGVTSKGDWNLTMGKIFQSILEKERHGNFLGKTVQFVPHVTDEIKGRIYAIAKEERADIIFIEIGGTIGDLENGLYLEAMRQLAWEQGQDNAMFVHLSYVPIPTGVNEQKSKPTQMSVKLLNEIGIQPDVVVCRCSEYLTPAIRRKISLFCNLPEENVLTGVDVDSVYLIPGELRKQGMEKIIENKMRMKFKCSDCSTWDSLAKKMCNGHKKRVKIGICGKYTALGDSYASVVEALRHSSANLDIGMDIEMIDTEKIEKGEKVENVVGELDGVIVPGGFGNRGWEGKIEVIRYARENNMPFLGICLGLQAAVAEFSRNVCGLADANSTEMNPKTKNKVITLMDEQQSVVDMGGTMRLGAYEANLAEGIISKLYNSKKVSERHRHRYEVNPDYHKVLAEKGLVISGLSPSKTLAEFIELPKHKYFVATQAHPELKSKLEKPAPLFYGLVKAASEGK